jgi:hypothetical protein
MKLKSIEKEAEACRKAFKNVEEGALCHCIHHGVHFEFLNEPAGNRISYILKEKPDGERALRLRLFRPVPKKYLSADWQKAYADWRKADAGKTCKKMFNKCCPWNGETIFPEGGEK